MPESVTPLRVLVPRAGAWGKRVASDIAARGGEAVVAPLIEARTVEPTAELDELLAAVTDGSIDWVFVTSASTVEQLVARGVRIPDGTRIAAVGQATARALESAGFRVDFTPRSRASAVSLVREWLDQHDPATTGRCLVLRGDLAMAVVSDELELRGFDVRVGILYRTVGVDLPEGTVRALEAGEIDAVLLTAGSVARELAHQVPDLHERVTLVSLGPSTTHVAERLGLRVSVTASESSVAAMLDALFLQHAKEHTP